MADEDQEFRTVAGPDQEPGLVLVFEDDPGLHGLYRRLFRRLHLFSRVEPGLACLARAALVITDLELPGGGGYEVLERMRSACPGVPALVVSGAAFEPPPGRRLPPLQVLPKPFHLEDLRDALRRWDLEALLVPLEN